MACFCSWWLCLYSFTVRRIVSSLVQVMALMLHQIITLTYINLLSVGPFRAQLNGIMKDWVNGNAFIQTFSSIKIIQTSWSWCFDGVVSMLSIVRPLCENVSQWKAPNVAKKEKNTGCPPCVTMELSYQYFAKSLTLGFVPFISLEERHCYRKQCWHILKSGDRLNITYRLTSIGFPI